MRQNKSADQLIDPRSQARKRLRTALWEITEAGGRKFCCAKCGYVPVGYSGGGRKDPALNRSNNLDANHINKNILDCDPVNGEWLCRTCHKNEDSVTAKGVSKIKDEMGYESY